MVGVPTGQDGAEKGGGEAPSISSDGEDTCNQAYPMPQTLIRL